MKGFVGVIFFKQQQKVLARFCYLARLTVNRWFHFFSSKGLGKSEVTSTLLTDTRICFYLIYVCLAMFLC